jgi:plastocyanin
MRVVFHAATGVLACLLMSAAAGQTPETGGITGEIKLTKRARGVPLPSNAYQPRTVNRRDSDVGPDVANVVVYLRNPAFRGPLPPMHAVIKQVNEAFTPRVVAITRGSTVAFPNGDPFFHNVFSLSGPATFDLGRFPQGESKARVFTRPGLVRVYCHIHSHMSATILVLDHPYFTVPNGNGTFTLSGIPAGRYTLVGWHERVGERAAIVQVEAGRSAPVNLSLPIEDSL